MTRLSDTTAESDILVRRFEVPTRLVHWLLAAPFVLLLLTGLTNFEPGLKATQVGGVRVFAWLHVVIGFAALGGAVLALIQLSRRSARTDLEALADVSLDDYLWFQREAITLAGGRSVGPRVGKFNAGQKLNALVSAGATVALLASFVESVFPWHTTIALLFIPVLLGHLYLAVLNPSTRESLRGITRGVVRRDWARRHHPAWLGSVEGEESRVESPAGD